MSRSLFCLNDPGIGGLTFGVRPYGDKHWHAYGCMKRRIQLKKDLAWREVQHLQNVMCKSDIWDGFPARGYTLVAAEAKAGDEDQRIDILYMRDDGALLPCELKLGGDSMDTHGQLMRYISDLHFQELNVKWVKDYHFKFLQSIESAAASHLHSDKFERFLLDNAIEDRFVRLLPRTGIIIDEGFKPQLLKAVRYLNGYCGFSLRLLQLETYVDEAWHPNLEDYMFRIDFVDIQ